MRGSVTRALLLVCAELGAGWGTARADCPFPRIQLVGLTGAWVSEVEALRAQLNELRDVDRCAQISVESGPGGAFVTVSLQDGREAVRSVPSPAGLRAIVVALLTLLPPSGAPTQPRSAPDGEDEAPGSAGVQSEPRTRAPPPSLRDPTAFDAPTPGTSSSVLRFDFGLAAGARWYGGPGGSLSLFAAAGGGTWLVDVRGRFDLLSLPSWTTGAPGYVLEDLDVGVDVGRRFVLGQVELILLVGPGVAVVSQQFSTSPTGPSAAANGRDLAVGRVEGGLRATLHRGSRLRPYLGIDGSLDAFARPAYQAVAWVPALPTWSAGASIGAQLEVRP